MHLTSTVLLGLFVLIATCAMAENKPVLRVGSKAFTEGYILAEILAQVIEDAGEVVVERKFGLGNTGIVYEALMNRKIDLYPEYTGTISEAILKIPSLADIEGIRKALGQKGLSMGDPLGFNNTYALAVKKETADRWSLKNISQLGKHPLRAGFTHEFLKREDCFPKLTGRYGTLFADVKGLAHGLSYEALDRGQIEITDIYSTDAKVAKFNLVVLEDDKKVFPDYLAVVLSRSNVPAQYPRTWKALQLLRGKLTEREMIRLNALAELDRKSFSEVAMDFLRKEPRSETQDVTHKLGKLTLQHLELVFLSLIASILTGIPLAILASRKRVLGQIILMTSGVIQTIPSLALLCFLIPLFGIGTIPALAALFLYGLLPIIRNTYVGLTTIDTKLLEVAKALGLSSLNRLRLIEIPLASPNIMSGVQTSAIINVGTATLAALIGAGGYGVPIVTGLALNDIPTILQGAIPAACLALAVHGLFELLGKIAIPRGLRS